MLPRLAVANWKMNGTQAGAGALTGRLVEEFRANPCPAQIVLCPPHLHLASVVDVAGDSGVMVGGQDCSSEDEGARTGDTSAPMLRDLDCTYVLVGHSERRSLHGEGDSLVWAKAEAALRAGLVPIICVGESAEERDSGKMRDRVVSQIEGSVPQGADASTVVAYEPVWAIGSGRVPSGDEISEAHGAIRDALVRIHGKGAWRVLYGGSVLSLNAAAIATTEGVDGLLVGGASLQAEGFWSICRGV